ncbi:MAG TPA: lamin tail domain-containing protein, partial [Bryobacteraceae bacterium]
MRQVWVSTVLLPLLFLGGGVALRGQMPILGEAPTATLPGPPPSNRGPEPRAVTLPPTLLWYDITNRETVRATWNQTFAPTSGVPLGWTGDVASNNPGTTTQAYKDAVATRINWFRAMAGVPAGVVLDPTYSAKDQKAALMFSANRALSHFPPSNWIDYSADGAEAAGKSNICAGFGLTTDTGCVLGYIIDNGSNNAAVGHRSALLFPQTTTMGTGDVPQTGSNYWANALWVQDANIFSTRPSTREAYVAWPPPGFVPYQVVGARWSFAYYNADFSAASVTMTRNGATVPVRLEPVVQTGCPPSICFPENTLVWVPDNLGTSNYTPVAPANDTTSTVTINNVKINGVSQSFTYSVTVFDPGTSGTTPSPGSLVISQVYGGGGNSGSMLRNDFLELFNPGSQSVTLTGWSLQYASATGTVWVRTLLSGVVPPGQYYLVQEHAEGGGSAALPTPDLVGDISMSATDGKIALVSNSDLLSGAAPSGAQMVDFVGYGGANFARKVP